MNTGHAGGAISPHDTEARRAILAFASTATVQHAEHQWAKLDMAGADLSLLNSGRAPLLADHECYVSGVIGVIDSAWVDGDQAFAIIRFATTPRALEAWGLVRDGIVSNVSMGFQHGTDLEDSQQERPARIDRWRPFEVSLVAVPRDWKTWISVDAPAPVVKASVDAAEAGRRQELGEAIQTAQRRQRRDVASALAPAVAARLGTDPTLTAEALAEAAG